MTSGVRADLICVLILVVLESSNLTWHAFSQNWLRKSNFLWFYLLGIANIENYQCHMISITMTSISSHSGEMLYNYLTHVVEITKKL